MKGKSRKPYCKSKRLESSFEESGVSVGAGGEPSDWNVNVCKSCAPVLVKYAETFKGMKRRGSELKRRNLINPHPKSANMEHY